MMSPTSCGAPSSVRLYDGNGSELPQGQQPREANTNQQKQAQPLSDRQGVTRDTPSSRAKIISSAESECTAKIVPFKIKA